MARQLTVSEAHEIRRGAKHLAETGSLQESMTYVCTRLEELGMAEDRFFLIITLGMATTWEAFDTALKGFHFWPHS